MGMRIRTWKMSDCISIEDTPEFGDRNTAEQSGAALQRRYEDHIGYQLTGGHGKGLICLCLTSPTYYCKDYC